MKVQIGVRRENPRNGAFILLDTGTEIPQPAARALVEFVRRLDGGAA